MNERSACLLDGGVRGAPATERAMRALSDLLAARGWDATAYTLREIEIAPCRGCFACWVKTPGECIIDDAGRNIARAAIRSDLLVYVTPITFGGCSSALKKAVDRMIPLILPYFTFVGSEVHHIRRYPTAPNLLGVGLLRGSDESQERIFKKLIRRNSINFHAADAETCFVYGDTSDARSTIAAALDEVIER